MGGRVCSFVSVCHVADDTAEFKAVRTAFLEEGGMPVGTRVLAQYEPMREFTTLT